MPTDDVEALARLVPHIHAAIAAQETYVADQLDAAVREGKMSLRFEETTETVMVAVIVDGKWLCAVDIRELVEL